MKTLAATFIIALTLITQSSLAFSAGESRPSNEDSTTQVQLSGATRKVSSDDEKKRDPFPRHHNGRIESRAGRN